MFRFQEAATNLEFNKIYDMAKPKVVAMLKSRFPRVDMSDIEEYYDKAMFDLYKKLEKDEVSEKKTLTYHIYNIAHNKLLDGIQASKKRRELFVADEFIFDDRWETAGTDEANGAPQALQDAVEEIVSHLEHPCDTLIPSRYYEKLKWSVVAQLSGYSSDKSVHSGHHTCLNKIRAVIVTKYRDLCSFLEPS
jgi:DNA-directed RNA polymerase specialized sigma24 family protein